ncbi:dynein regulatory complex protein 8 [Symphorus nematophorus]
MQTGVFMDSHLGRLVPHVLSLFMLIQLCLAAPGQPGTQREESVDARPPVVALANPFGSGEEDRRLLQSYIQSSLKDGEGGPEISSWEQEVFFLFRLYDYDRSGLLDGLEMMKLLSDYNSHHAPGAWTSELVVSMVDFLLQTQDLNQDGLLAPSELLSPPLPLTQDSSNNDAPHQEQEVGNPNTDNERAGAAEQGGEVHEELMPKNEEQTQQEVKTEEEELIKHEDEQHGQQIPEAPAAAQGQPQEVPVHAIVSDVHKRIKAAFEAFDYESNSTVEVREIGTIIHSLGCFPTQAGLQGFIAEVEEAGYVHLDKFLPAMTKVLLEHKFPPIPEDLLLQAFEVLDKEKKGYLEPRELTKYMTQEGEVFSQEEMDEMLTALGDQEKSLIYYKDLISQLTVDPDM